MIFNFKHILSIATIFIVAVTLSTSCKKDVKGCTDPKSSNYNPNATMTDGSCDNDTTGGGGGGTGIITGCTNPNADNYNPLATQDDGSCVFSGCTDPTADNYDPNATTDNGTCIDMREKFTGTWDVTTDCGFIFALDSPQEIFIDSQDPDKTVVYISSFLFGTPAYAVIDKFNIEFPDQNIQGFIDFVGSGSINAAKDKITIEFTYSSQFGGTQTCTAEYTKQ